MAVASARGTGVGAKVLDALMAKATELGYPELILNAQTHAAPFYARVGFEQVGDEFEEAGIPHIEMRKRSADPPEDSQRGAVLCPCRVPD
jgi:predicted GNAT family N-acyltransferase